jgi:hypothetical protein
LCALAHTPNVGGGTVSGTGSADDGFITNQEAAMNTLKTNARKIVAATVALSGTAVLAATGPAQVLAAAKYKG